MNNKVIVITGVSSGIGKAFVLSAAKRDDIMVVGIGRKDIPNFKSKNYAFIKTDLSNSLTIKRSFNKLNKSLGRVDVLINNAGFAYRSTIEDLSPNEITEQFQVNLVGPIYLTSLIVGLMRKQKRGHIINVSSVGSIVSTPTLGYYAATKAGFDKLSEVLKQEVEKYNIKVSNLYPGAVKSDFGKNIRSPLNYSKTDYKPLYEEWKNRFASFFKVRNSPEEVSNELWNLIEKPQRVKYVHVRDLIMCLAKRLLPYQIFQFLFLGYFYKHES